MRCPSYTVVFRYDRQAIFDELSRAAAVAPALFYNPQSFLARLKTQLFQLLNGTAG